MKKTSEILSKNLSSIETPSSISQTATLWVVAAVQFLVPFMFSAVGVALPTIGREFSVGAAQLGLIEMIYILAIALLLLPAGRFSDIYGRKRIFIAGAIVITLATLALSVASTIETFIAFRFLQGVGAAFVTSTSFAILTSVFPKEQRGRAMGIVVGCVYLGVSAGPTLAGLMVTYLGWRWIFYAAVPVELAALVLTLLKLKGEWADARGEKFDWLGSMIYIAALFGLVSGITHFKEWETAKWITFGGASGMLVFLVYEWNTQSPLLSIRPILQNRTFAFSNIATWINYATSFGVVFFFSIYLQSIRGISPKNTGYILIVQPIVQAIFAPIAGRLSDQHSPAKIATIGMGLCAAGLATAATLSDVSSFYMIFSVLILLGLGFGIFSTPNTAVIMGSVHPREFGMASSMVATMRSMGMLTSMTIVTMILSLSLGNQPVSIDTGPAFIESMRTTLVIFSVMSVMGIGFSLVRIAPARSENHSEKAP